MLQQAHKVVLHGTQLPGTGKAQGPVILKRNDQAFIPAILDDIRAGEAGLTRIAGTVAQPAGQGLRLYQPIHRIFHVALLETSCDFFNGAAFPRLDRREIHSMGLVIRRIAQDRNGKELQTTGGDYVYEAWQSDNHKLMGWVRFTEQVHTELDPNPAYRPVVTYGHAALDAHIPLRQRTASLLEESVSPLFAAPDDACAAAHKTVLYGIVPVFSPEVSERAAKRTLDGVNLNGHMPLLLQEGNVRQLSSAGFTVNYTFAQRTDTNAKRLMNLLRQVVIEFDGLGDSRASRDLFEELNRIRLPMVELRTVASHLRNARQGLEDAGEIWYIGAGDFIKDAAPILLELQNSDAASPPTLLMPYEWPAISSNQAQGIVKRAKACLEQQLETNQPGEAKFSSTTHRYVVRAFVRVKQADNCPPQLVWSKPSVPFTIAPWHETGDQPPVQVPLPNLFNRDTLRNLKPNVAFSMPEQMFNFLNNLNPEAALAGEANRPDSGGLGIEWICSFSIPIITICAFILLYIILQLLNIVFWWLPFVRICLPFPKAEQ
jgi:hypothetical protein